MVNYCCVPQCHMKAKHGIHFHKFPNSRALRKIWLIKLRYGKVPSKWASVCSKHFSKHDYQKSNSGHKLILKPNAVPTKCLPNRKFDRLPHKRKNVRDKITKRRLTQVMNKICRRHIILSTYYITASASTFLNKFFFFEFGFSECS